MSEGLVTAAYLVAAMLFIFSLAGLSQHETARTGNLLSIIGMLLALIATVLSHNMEHISWIIVAMLMGGAIGLYLAIQVKMTAMPELIAILHSFVGLASVLVGLNSYLLVVSKYVNNIVIHNDLIEHIHRTEIFLGMFIGIVTFIGSVVAFGKLCGKIPSPPFRVSHRHQLNIIALLVSFILMVLFVRSRYITLQIVSLVLMTIIAVVFGWHLVAAIGGADMPVIVSMLNSYSGWAAAAAGFILNHDLLIITGALVGSSGAILSYLMCKAMNRSFLSVITGGFGTDVVENTSNNNRGKYHETTTEEVTELLKNSRSVIITPGYGMAVAQAQSPVFDLMSKLRNNGIKVRFGIHPVAGRLPGHMNVLLAEAKVPYDLVLGLDEINNDFRVTDTVLVIGANDTINPAAIEEQGSPLAGMPVLEVWKAHNVVVLKRSMNHGYAGVPNPLFFKANTRMLFGDAKHSLEAILRLL